MYDFLVVGHMCIDEVLIGGRARTGVGGSAFYTGFNLASFGWRVCVLSKIGIDFTLPLPGIQGLDLSLVKRTSRPTTRFRLVYGEDAERTLKLLSKCDDIASSDIPEGLEAKIIHICPIANEISVGAIKRLKEIKGTISLEAQGLVRSFDESGEVRLRKPQQLVDVIKGVDILKADGHEIEAIADGLGNIKAFFDLGVKIIVVTKGARGAFIHTRDGIIQVPAAKVEGVQDPTGAGDVFMAGFLHGLREGLSVEDSGLYGIAAASCIIKKFDERIVTAVELNEALERLKGQGLNRRIRLAR